MTTDNTTKKLLASLRNHAPHTVRAYTSDDDFRNIAVPQRRKRWAQVIEAIEARAWSRVELLDKSGGVLGYVENAEPATTVEELPPGPASKMRHECEWIVALVVKAQRDAMQFRDDEVKSLLSAQGDVVREMVVGMQALSSIYREQRDAASEVAAMQATAAAGSGDGAFNMKELVDAAPAILQALPMLRALLTGGNGNAPPNGAHTAKPKG